ncbi:hypothetical protein [Glycomyces tarimensis]
MTDTPGSSSAPDPDPDGQPYQPYIPPPPQYQYQPASGFSAMPGGGKGAVVLLWILFGFGICAGLIAIVALVGIFTVLSSSSNALGVVQSEYPLLLPVFVVMVLQVVAWTILRGVFAVRIIRRSSSARSGAVALEVIGIALTIVSTLVLMSMEIDGEPLSGTGDLGGTCIGLILSGIVIGLLSTTDMREWCDR